MSCYDDDDAFENLYGKVKQAIRKTIAELIPDKAWKEIIREELKSMLEGNGKHEPEAKLLARRMIAEMLKTKIQTIARVEWEKWAEQSARDMVASELPDHDAAPIGKVPLK